MKLNNIQVTTDQLLLDPNNYRFHDVSGYRTVKKEARYAEPRVQAKALELLEATASFSLDSLKDSIRTNGFIPVDQIVVDEIAEDESGNKLYLVVEGNRRIAAIKALLREDEEGSIDLDSDKKKDMTTIHVVEVKGDSTEKADYRQTLMAIRHVAGIREWGPFQQAKLVVELYDSEGQNFSRVAQRIGISAVEVGRRYRAAKSLQQMEADEEFGEHFSPKLYSFFHEAVSQPKVRSWLGFSDTTYEAENEEARRGFYELLSPREIDGETRPAKLTNANREVRQLKDIVEKERALRILLDPEKEFADAVAAAMEDEVPDESGVLESSLAQAIRRLNEPGVKSWSNPSSRAKELWKELMALVQAANKFFNEAN